MPLIGGTRATEASGEPSAVIASGENSLHSVLKEMFQDSASFRLRERSTYPNDWALRTKGGRLRVPETLLIRYLGAPKPLIRAVLQHSVCSRYLTCNNAYANP